MISGDHARDITVSKYTLTLIWPVILHGNPDGNSSKKPLIAQWAKWFCSQGWDDVLTKYDDEDTTPIPEQYKYAEIVYFHPFVRDFLMGDGGTKKQDLATRILTRQDVKQVRVEVLPEKIEEGRIVEEAIVHQFAVGRVELHLMKPGVALLAVEINAIGKTLHELMQFQDRFRRIYPPFWAGNEPGLCVRQVTWLGENDQELHASDVTKQKDNFEQFVQQGAEPPVCEHWRFFFGKLPPLNNRQQLEDRKTGRESQLCYQQLTDERIPTMSYFAVPNPERISQGDYDRLTFIDDAADQVNGEWLPNTYPYNPAFLEKTRSQYRYERFSHYGTTYLACGYGFTVVGKDEWFFNNVIHDHFCHHYFRMGLIAHYQRAALLYFGDELSNAIKDLAGEDPSKELLNEIFRKHIEELQMNFLKFRSRAYFPEVSNQLQAQELWQFWFQHLNTPKLFESVDGTSQRLTDVLAESESRHLTRFASWGVPFGLGLSVLAIVASFLSQGDLSKTEWVWMLISSFISLYLIFAYTARSGYLGLKMKKMMQPLSE